eukprot:TRINITY_DN44536_c0_g1_i1.p1 TRINITY_DN44536_c0_g1~~TRINITY_DN44536_c0_g1_i1.p1  ORF type:complete len:283 (+),score=82.32 TRINITY_DN44536_c0_g1_i1:72-920(+)
MGEPAEAAQEKVASEQLDEFKKKLEALKRGGTAAGEQAGDAIVSERERREFHLKEFWEARYAGRPGENEDWLCVWSDVSEALLPKEGFEGWVRPSDRTLTVGCGNSTMPGEMFLDGIRLQTATDYSPVVVQQMISSYPEEFLQYACTRDSELGVKAHEPGENILWQEADATSLLDTYERGSFDLVVAKTLLDTLLCSPKRDVLVDAFWTSVWDVLTPEGRFLSLDLHPLENVVGWMHAWSKRHKRSWKLYPVPYDVLSRVPTRMRGKVQHSCFVAVKDGELP